LGYEAHWCSGKRKGYSGVATLSRTAPEAVERGFGIPRFDDEGRVLITTHRGVKILNIYFPNGQMRDERLKYKLDFYDATLDYCLALVKKGEKLVVCGDYNTAHREIDIARPKENETTSGFLPVERAWMDKWAAAGFVDTFRRVRGDVKDEYSWWSFRSASRERNVGWRIDYHFVSENLAKAVKDAGIHQNVMGSDHCPVSLVLEL
jgi:exodeoxyribonuclease-3